MIKRYVVVPVSMLMLLSFVASVSAQGFGRLDPAAREERRRLTRADHQGMMKLLDITALRPGRNGMNPDADNYANYDQRFANAYVSSSGAGGASIWRRDWGEIVENVAGSGEYHWMAGNFLKYAGPLGWDDLPTDAHELVALCAPRPVFISGGSVNGDAWVDAKGMFLAAAGAGASTRCSGRRTWGPPSSQPSRPLSWTARSPSVSTVVGTRRAPIGPTF